MYTILWRIGLFFWDWDRKGLENRWCLVGSLCVSLFLYIPLLLTLLLHRFHVQLVHHCVGGSYHFTKHIIVQSISAPQSNNSRHPRLPGLLSTQDQVYRRYPRFESSPTMFAWQTSLAVRSH
jgi:hypothetical protein